MTRTLVTLRHGKSAYPEGVADHDRPLAPRGERQAALAGAWIRSHERVELVLCSSATRTRQTLERADIDAPVEYLDDLYAASHLDYLNVVRAHGGGHARTVLLVGHEPAISATVLELANDRVSDAARAVERKYPTSAVAVLRHHGSWESLESGHCDLAHFHVPGR